MCRGIVSAIGLAILALACVANGARAEVRDGTYHGMIVCEKMKNSKYMLIAPLDIIIAGKTITAARPIFNLEGSHVVATEIATGTVADDGTLNFLSNWQGGGGSSFQGNYRVVITEKSGTLTGTQEWTTADGKQSRSCAAAVIQTRS